MTPAKEVGGDFYDFFFVNNDRLALVIADVSGKGIPAAMFMMIKSMIQTQAASGRGPKEVLETVNRLIYESDIESRMIEADCTEEDLRQSNRCFIEAFTQAGEKIVIIDEDFEQNIDAQSPSSLGRG